MIAIVVALLAGLPLSVWLDLRSISESALRTQANDLNVAVTGIRSFYASDVVGRVLASHGKTVVTDRYATIPGAIPIPATFSLQLGQVIGEHQRNFAYKFTSDYPFRRRMHPPLDAFERDALHALRADPTHEISSATQTGFTEQVRVIAPIRMGATCVACHNTHPDSPKRDWKVGDVRGIQELTVTQPIVTSLFSFRYLLVYFAIAAATGIAFILLLRRQTEELTASYVFLSSISKKISRYLAPQIYDAIFTGRADVTLSTRRKKLTIFFSDIKDFTSTTERLQPEELTALLNEYLTEMSTIALAHGGTIDKFVGDAILVFFGDPESRGIAEDAEAAVKMAVAMQARIAELNAEWRHRGIESPFRVRMGLNTGYCNVGNFGSADRFDYTIIGAEANLAARLQSIANAGEIVLSYETYALVRELVIAHALAPITVKGISREIVPYAIDGLAGSTGARGGIYSAHATGVDLYLDVTALDPAAAERTRTLLADALAALERRNGAPGEEGGR